MIDISTYLNRITSEHKNKPSFTKLVKARLEPFIDLCELLEDIDKSFDLDTASGAQLDIIGQYVGVSRLLDFQPNSRLTAPRRLLPNATESAYQFEQLGRKHRGHKEHMGYRVPRIRNPNSR